jgi:hypothetical protein
MMAHPFGIAAEIVTLVKAPWTAEPGKLGKIFVVFLIVTQCAALQGFGPGLSGQRSARTLVSLAAAQICSG